MYTFSRSSGAPVAPSILVHCHRTCPGKAPPTPPGSGAQLRGPGSSAGQFGLSSVAPSGSRCPVSAARSEARMASACPSAGAGSNRRRDRRRRNRRPPSRGGSSRLARRHRSHVPSLPRRRRGPALRGGVGRPSPELAWRFPFNGHDLGAFGAELREQSVEVEYLVPGGGIVEAGKEERSPAGPCRGTKNVPRTGLCSPAV